MQGERKHVDVIVVNGTPVDFNCLLENGDRVAVYPPFRSIDLGDIASAGVNPR